MTHQLFNPSRAILMTSGLIRPSWKVEFFLTTTTTPTPVYTTSALSTTHTQPVEADSGGVLPAIYLDPSITYKASYYDENDVLQYTDDPVNDNLLSQDAIAELLHPITAIEQSAGVTPTDKVYPEGDLRRYGGVDDYGAGNTDNATALTALAAVASAAALANELLESGSFTCYLRGSNGFCAASAVSFPAGCNVIMEVPLVYTGSSNITFFSYGSSAALSYGRKLVLDVQNADSSPDWASESFIGVSLKNLAHCEVDLSVKLFTIGAKLWGHATSSDPMGFTYNRVSLGVIGGNKIGLMLSNRSDSSGFGYCNENIFYGGGFQTYSGNDASVDHCAVRITSDDGTYAFNNNNVFYKPSFEMSNTLGAGEALAVDVVHGRWNWFMQARDEGNDLVMRAANDSMQNVVVLGTRQSSTSLLEETGAANQNVVTDGNNIPRFYYSHQVCAHQLGGRAEGTSGTATRIPGVAFALSSDSAPKQVGGTGITFSNSSATVTISGSDGVGVFVDTSTVKSFIVSVKGTAGGRVGVVCYDSGGSIIHDSDLVGVPTFFAEVAFFGSNIYQTTADLLTPIYFRVSSDVSRIFVMVMGGTSSAVISGFAVHCLPGDVAPRSWTGFTDRPYFEDTAANLADITNAVNTTSKFASKLVWDVTNNRMMRARGAANNSVWDVIDGSASVTPV